MPRWFFFAAALILALLGVILEYPNKVAVFDQPQVCFDGPDDYMRTWRAKQIAAGETLRVRHIAEINAPAGAELHWTAPMDYLLAGAGLAFSPLVTGHPDPFGCVAAWVPLALGVVYLVSMMMVMRRGFGWQAALLVGLLIVLSPSWHRVFRVGHPDHHCLIALLLLFVVGAWIPAARADGSPGEPRRRAALLSGLAMGAAIWVSVEALVFWVAMVVALWAACTFGSRDDRRAYARARLAWNWATLVTLAAAHVFENWPDLVAMAADKVSLVHVILAAMGFLVPGGVAVVAADGGRGRTEVGRYIAMLLALAVCAAILVLRPGRVFEHVSRPEFTRWINNLMEFQPLYVQAGSHWSLWPLHGLMGFFPYALPVLVVFVLRSRQAPRAAKYVLALLAPTITILAIFQLRWIDHFNLAVVPLAVIGVWELAKTVSRRAEPAETRDPAEVAPHGLKPGALVGVVILLAVLTFPAVKTVVTFGVDEARQTTESLRRADLVAQEINACERRRPNADPRRRAILSDDGDGPELLYWTGLPVVATPYHRALDGLMLAAKFFAERDPIAARAQLDRLGVRYVVMPAHANEQLMQFEQMAFGELRSFDPPTEGVDANGGPMLKLNYRPQEVVRTMAYRLVMESERVAIPGVERIAEINEGAKAADGRPLKTGLLYLVHEPAPTSPAITSSATK